MCRHYGSLPLIMACYLCLPVWRKELTFMKTMDSGIKDEVFVDEYTGGIVGPSLGFAATIKDGGHIRCVVPPGCWGPMITPEFHGGHEVTRPVAVGGARVGESPASNTH